MTNLLEIYLEWQHNHEFRAAFKKNPEAALLQAGFHLKPEDLDKIKNMIKLDNEKLDERISK